MWFGGQEADDTLFLEGVKFQEKLACFLPREEVTDFSVKQFKLGRNSRFGRRVLGIVPSEECEE